ncbi:hypothetical protein PFISCL1PPCAC_15602 [Pristionchus fissidentatus]|uniref:G protein-coupled receptor n=1 Tax=Pristionchus fissidentatus TaxID=1538716 RepID=A0AAV5VXN4_9BILA|nr:hypothetical protein PFISCL1PPCAC_15602 [Pristionchus fissidentatus]
MKKNLSIEIRSWEIMSFRRFVLYLSLLVFTILFCLRFDDKLSISYLTVFSPLFLCNLIVFMGCFIGAISFFTRQPQLSEVSLRLDFIRMLFTTAEHSFLCVFEYLLMVKVEDSMKPVAERQLRAVMWVVVFIPLFLQCCAAILISIWAVRRDKAFEFEIFFSVNIVQFAFIAFKLDNLVDWSWSVVFVPLWVLLSLSIVGVLYALILALLLTRSRHIPSNRRTDIYTAILQTLLVVPSLVSLFLLTGKLDVSHSPSSYALKEMTYSTVGLPLMCTLFCLLVMSLTSSGGNVWWFALRRSFCSFLLDSCPGLRQYANVSYKVGMIEEGGDLPSATPPLFDDSDCLNIRSSIPITTIELPD